MIDPRDEQRLKNYASAYLLLRQRNPELARRFYCRYESEIQRAFDWFLYSLRKRNWEG